MTIFCLFCGNSIFVHNRLKIGDQLSCTQCKTMFTLINKAPIQIDWLQLNDGEDKVSDVGENSLEEADL